LDFGIAKALADDPASADISNSPTLTKEATRAGIILGTAAYMSPEQARGKTLDRRAEIWSFGCVLFEMLSGKPVFQGETVTDTLAAVLSQEPDWGRLPTATPAAIRRLLGRCLQKDVKRRLQAVGDARIEIEEALAAKDSGELARPSSASYGSRWEVRAGRLSSFWQSQSACFLARG
jgi:serine/threonine protein kinase